MNPRYRAVARIDKIVCKNKDNFRCKMQKKKKKKGIKYNLRDK